MKRRYILNQVIEFKGRRINIVGRLLERKIHQRLFWYNISWTWNCMSDTLRLRCIFARNRLTVIFIVLNSPCAQRRTVSGKMSSIKSTTVRVEIVLLCITWMLLDIIAWQHKLSPEGGISHLVVNRIFFFREIPIWNTFF